MFGLQAGSMVKLAMLCGKRPLVSVMNRQHGGRLVRYGSGSGWLLYHSSHLAEGPYFEMKVTASASFMRV